MESIIAGILNVNNISIFIFIYLYQLKEQIIQNSKKCE